MHTHVAHSLSAIRCLHQVAQILGEDVPLDITVTYYCYACQPSVVNSVLQLYQTHLIGSIVLEDHQIPLTRGLHGMDYGVDRKRQHRVARRERITLLGLLHGLEQFGIYLLLLRIGVVDHSYLLEQIAYERKVLDAPAGPFGERKKRQDGYYGYCEEYYQCGFTFFHC